MYRAWAFWVNSSQGFGTALNTGWGFSNCDKAAKSIQNKKERFKEELQRRLESTQIECVDALRHCIHIEKPLGVAKAKGVSRKRKIEVLTANYPI